MQLTEYLQWALKQPWGWGTEPGLDCCKLVARWVMACGHADPMVTVEPYDSEFSALRRIRDGGGLVALWTAGMEHVGIPVADEPQSGDVAVISRASTCGSNEVLAIFTGQRWASLALSGIEFGPAHIIKAWRP